MARSANCNQSLGAGCDVCCGQRRLICVIGPGDSGPIQRSRKRSIDTTRLLSQRLRRCSKEAAACVWPWEITRVLRRSNGEVSTFNLSTAEDCDFQGTSEHGYLAGVHWSNE